MKDYTNSPPLNVKEIDEVIGSIKEIPTSTIEQEEELSRNIALIMIGWLTAFRVSEILSLKRANFRFDLAADEGLYDRVEDVKNLKQKEYTKSGKKNRYARLTKKVLWRKDEPYASEVRTYVKSFPSMDYHIFPRRKMVYGWNYQTDYDTPMTRQQVFKVFKSYGIDGTHALRHSRLTYLAEVKGLNEVQLQSFSAHSSAGSLKPYVHLSPNMYKELI